LTLARDRTCQKDDWGSHKQHCGKEKIAKKLHGTIHDLSWRYPDTSDSVRSLAESAQNGKVHVTSLGFGTPHPSNPHSPALQRQVALLEGDKDVDYVLFDDTDGAIRIILDDIYLKMDFRIVRAEVMFAVNRRDADPGIMAEYLIKVTTGNWPGLSRASILAQFEKEYGGDVAAHVAILETKGVQIGYGPGKTFFEENSAKLWAIRNGRFPGRM
jgi:hypothetical protein